MLLAFSLVFFLRPAPFSPPVTSATCGGTSFGRRAHGDIRLPLWPSNFLHEGSSDAHAHGFICLYLDPPMYLYKGLIDSIRWYLGFLKG